MAGPLPTLPGQINTAILTPPPGDKSVELFDFIFGDNWSSLFTTLGTHTPNVLFDLLQAFNTVVMAGVSVVVVYMLFIGTMGTAHEGTALGKRYNSVYVPFRIALSMAMLAPLPNVGISMLQVMGLSLASMSFGGASTLTTAATTFMVDNGGGLVGRPNPANEMESIRKTVIENLVFQQYQSREMGLTFPSTYFSVKWEGTTSHSSGESGKGISSTGRGEWVYTFNASQGINLNTAKGEAGTVRVYCNNNADNLCTVRKNAMTGFINNLVPVAQSIMNGSYSNGGFQHNSNASKAYANSISGMRADLEGRTSDNYEAYLAKVKQSIDESGWMFLGAFYWTIDAANNEATEIYSNRSSATSVNWDKMKYQNDGHLMSYIDRVGKMLRLQPTSAEDISLMANALTPQEVLNITSHGVAENETSTVGVMPSADSVMGLIGTGSIKWNEVLTNIVSAPFKGLLDYMIGGLASEKHDPLSSMSSVGHSMIMTGEAFLLLGTGIDVAKEGMNAGAIAAKSDSAVGIIGGLFGGTIPLEVIRAGAVKAISYVVMALQAAAIPLIVAGVGLAFYLPMVPFMLYTFGVLTVLILTIESIVLMPMWGAALAMPDGEGMLGQTGKQGFTLLLGILLRPPLLVIGFFMSFLIMAGIGKILGFLLLIATGGVLAGHFVGPVTVVAMLIISSVFIISVAHKIFGITTWLPDNAMRWTGQQIQNLGEGNDAKGIGGVVAGHVSTGGNTARMMGAGASGAKNPGGKELDGSQGNGSGDEKSGSTNAKSKDLASGTKGGSD